MKNLKIALNDPGYIKGINITSPHNIRSIYAPNNRIESDFPVYDQDIRIEYLEFSGSQYVDLLDYSIESTSEISTKIQFTNKGGSQFIWCDRLDINTTGSGYSLLNNSGSIRYDHGKGNHSTQIKPVIGTEYFFEVKDGGKSLWCNSELELTCNIDENHSPNETYVRLGRNQGGTGDMCFFGKMWWFKLDGVLFLPAKIEETEGMFSLGNGKFYPKLNI